MGHHHHFTDDDDLEGFSTMLAEPEPPGTEGEDPRPIRDRIVDRLKTVYDPEIPVDIWELGLIYDVAIREDGTVAVKMTLTSPFCPVAGILPGEVEAKVRSVKGVTAASVEIVWDPPWSPDMMSEAAKLEVGMY
jgi:FeS assembly SUF system protein